MFCIAITLGQEFQWGKEEVIKTKITYREAREMPVLWGSEAWWPWACGCGVEGCASHVYLERECV